MMKETSSRMLARLRNLTCASLIHRGARIDAAEFRDAICGRGVQRNPAIGFSAARQKQ